MKADVYQIVTDKIIQRLELGVLPWKHYSTLRAEECAPRNLVSQRQYHGVNFFLLSMMGYRSPNWITFRQAQELGGHVRKGEHSMPIVYWNFVERTEISTKSVCVPFSGQDLSDRIGKASEAMPFEFGQMLLEF
jgi:antirestriction protein ArdC